MDPWIVQLKFNKFIDNNNNNNNYDKWEILCLALFIVWLDNGEGARGSGSRIERREGEAKTEVRDGMRNIININIIY